MRKHLSLLLMVFLLPLFVCAQGKLSVANFQKNENGMEALLEGTKKLDLNGEPCAIIKVVSTPPLKGLSFDTGQLAVVDVTEKTAETWVYVPKGIKRIQIAHPNLGSIDYRIPIAVEAGRTYTLRLTGDQVQTLTFNDSKSQDLILEVEPKGAMVIINGTVENAVGGIINKRLSFGTHSYTVRAEGYYDQSGTITINDDKAPQRVSVNLKPHFGWLSFANYSILDDAKLLIDFNGEYVNITDAALRLGSGRHSIRIVKPLYETYEAEVNISDNDTTTISPMLEPNYGTCSFLVSNPETEIWIDNDLRGKGPMKLQIGTGKHRVRCKLKSHRDSELDIAIMNGEMQTITLPSPDPIYGSINIKSSEQAYFYIDDDEKYNSHATANFFADKVLIGEHEVKVMKKGFKTVTLNVTVEEGKTVDKTVNMLAVSTVTFDSNPEGASFRISGYEVYQDTITPVTLELKTGEPYTLTFKKWGYYKWSGRRTFNKDETFNKNLARNFYRSDETTRYIELGYQTGKFNALHGAIGIYASGFNCEFAVKYGLKKSEEFYFSDIDVPDASIVSMKLQPISFEGKFGWGIVLGHDKFVNRLRLTPQVGACYTMINGNSDAKSLKNSDSQSNQVTYVASGIASLRLQFAMCKGVSLSLMPSYYIPFAKGSLYKQMEKLSDDVKGWGTGMNFTASINFFF